MAKPHRLKEVEQEVGNLEDVIPRLVNTLGSQKLAAIELGVSESTVCKWLKENGYAPVIVYRKLQENPA